jgi:hypothetical protein
LVPVEVPLLEHHILHQIIQAHTLHTMMGEPLNFVLVAVVLEDLMLM